MATQTHRGMAAAQEVFARHFAERTATPSHSDELPEICRDCGKEPTSFGYILVREGAGSFICCVSCSAERGIYPEDA